MNEHENLGKCKKKTKKVIPIKIKEKGGDHWEGAFKGLTNIPFLYLSDYIFTFQ